MRVVVDAAGRCMSVSDSGPGIDPVLRDKMLTRFARGVEADTEGCGLGLSIVARIAAILGARLHFEQGLARPEGGEGLAVVLTFPPAIDSSSR